MGGAPALDAGARQVAGELVTRERRQPLKQLVADRPRHVDAAREPRPLGVGEPRV
jgi:hypothetical protein